MAFDSQFSGFIQFLRDEISENKTAALPPPSEHIALSHSGLMQYFLFPRRTTNCPESMGSQACLDQIGGPGVYVLKVGGFPDPGLEAGLEKAYIPFDERWGLYLPDEGD